MLARHFAMGIMHNKGLPPFHRILPTIVSSKETTVLRQKVSSRLRKGAIEEVHPSQTESSFYSQYFVVPKKDGGL